MRSTGSGSLIAEPSGSAALSFDGAPRSTGRLPRRWVVFKKGLLAGRAVAGREVDPFAAPSGAISPHDGPVQRSAVREPRLRAAATQTLDQREARGAERSRRGQQRMFYKILLANRGAEQPAVACFTLLLRAAQGNPTAGDNACRTRS